MLFVGLRCPSDVVAARRRAAGYDDTSEAVLRWQQAVHGGWRYDVELDTSRLSPVECAAAIEERLAAGPPPTAFAELAAAKLAP